jgi:hypothetical protein
MAVPTLTPSSTTSAVTLPETGSFITARVIANYPLGIYADTDSSLYDHNFISGAVDHFLHDALPICQAINLLWASLMMTLVL